MLIQNNIVSETGAEPITTAYLKNYLRIGFDTDDDTITSVLKSARQLVEKYIEQALVSKNYKAYFYSFEEWDVVNYYYKLELPISPVTTVTAVKIVAVDGTETATTDFTTTGLDEKTITVPIALNLAGSVGVGYIVEYTAFNDAIDEPIKDAICKLAGELYENRQDSAVDVSISALPFDVKRILNVYRKTFI
jgi:uncharacterized phiE125 gp8 family phage protein